MAERAARAYALELNRVGTDLADATDRLRCAFAELAVAEQSANDGGDGDGGPYRDDWDSSAEKTSSDGVPDPMMLLHRLSRLEEALPGLRERSRDLAVRRPTVVRETCEALTRNAREIQTLSASIGISDELVDGGDDGRNNGADDEWFEVVSRVSDEQRKHTMMKMNRSNSSSSRATATDGPHAYPSTTDARLANDDNGGGGGDEDEAATSWASSVVAAAGARRRRQRGPSSTPAIFAGRG